MAIQAGGKLLKADNETCAEANFFARQKLVGGGCPDNTVVSGAQFTLFDMMACKPLPLASL